MTAMQIDFERSGGFAGLSLRLSLDTKQLPPAGATALEKMIQDSGFFDLPAQIQSGAPGADRFEYRVTITSQPLTHSLVVNEAAVPDTLQPLLDHLTELARKK
jgi:hypothetical protein